MQIRRKQNGLIGYTGSAGIIIPTAHVYCPNTNRPFIEFIDSTWTGKHPVDEEMIVELATIVPNRKIIRCVNDDNHRYFIFTGLREYLAHVEVGFRSVEVNALRGTRQLALAFLREAATGKPCILPEEDGYAVD